MGPVEFTPWHRNEIRALGDVKQTFSSWDSCMQKAYCNKPPQRSKYADPPPPTTYQPPPPVNYGYQPSAPPVYNTPAPQYSSPVAQYAQFDTRSQKPVNEDALPQMPSWQNATTRRVEDTSQDVEMSPLNPTATTTNQTLGTIGRSRSGYQEVPSQPSSPRFAPESYRGTELAGAPTNPASIGVAHSIGPNNPPYRNHSPIHNNGGGIYADTSSRPYPRSQTSSPAPPQNAYSPYSYQGQQQQQQQLSGYTAYGPSATSTPPPPFSSSYSDSNVGRQTPSALQVGRKPVENSWKEV
ncbi:hypothetical protein PRK78_003546 [Emydomyces testavorans]|uniref:Uncharacterized protein n=1 Tax=Emydomyces testavorans TaxID=2070801 RepID=A0AAF0IKP5_9EURO|nr:hypothetical protein PRK78_003546 [Emydomyces testavorans]